MKDFTKTIASALAYAFGLFFVLNFVMWISKNV